jgi:hypothetical protein
VGAAVTVGHHLIAQAQHEGGFCLLSQLILKLATLLIGKFIDAADNL